MMHISKDSVYTSAGDYIMYPVRQYYGESCLNLPYGIREEFREDAKRYIGKECTVDKGYKGVIIGFEDNSYYKDYYYIVFVPETQKIVYALANSAGFTATIK